MRTVDLNAFTSGLPRLSGSDIRLISKALDATVATPEDEVTWWRAIMLVDNALDACEYGEDADLPQALEVSPSGSGSHLALATVTAPGTAAQAGGPSVPV